MSPDPLKKVKTRLPGLSRSSIVILQSFPRIVIITMVILFG
jgi:hypothetical protein